MKIEITELEWATAVMTKKLDNFEFKQIARQVEKFLLKKNINCEVLIK